MGGHRQHPVGEVSVSVMSPGWGGGGEGQH